MESSASSSTSSAHKFKALWKEIISYLSLTYAVLVVKPQAVSKVEKLIRKGRPDDLPSYHPFLADYEEFVTVFEHGVSQFQDNEKAISQGKLNAQGLPRIDYDMRSRKLAIAISWSIIFTSSAIAPIVLYFTLKYVAKTTSGVSEYFHTTSTSFTY